MVQTGDINSTNLLIRDMRALIDRLQEDGCQRFVCMGTTTGGSTRLRAAMEEQISPILHLLIYNINKSH